MTAVATFHRHEDLPQREAALVVDLDVGRPLRDHRVHEHAILALVDEHEDAAEHADLGRREPHAVRLVHERRHPLHEPVQVVVEALDLPRLHAQHAISVLPDAGERDESPRLPLELPVRRFRARARGGGRRDRGRGRPSRGESSRAVPDHPTLQLAARISSAVSPRVGTSPSPRASRSARRDVALWGRRAPRDRTPGSRTRTLSRR